MDPRTVLDFWFGAGGSPVSGQVRDLWFTKSEATDAEIRERFGAAIDAALRGELEYWIQSAEGSLALVIVLDQFTRNVFRDTSRAFAGDAAALGHARDLVYSGADRHFGTLQRWFIYMPFEHSENLVDQYEALRLFAALADDGESAPLDWARKHFEVILRFGRFPHRNAILGRASTPEEAEFLHQPGSRF
jgi:uncharacterized protein (DUF924 family)